MLPPARVRPKKIRLPRRAASGSFRRFRGRTFSMADLVLASTSPARRALLEQVGLAFRAEAPGVEERLDPAADPIAQARDLALRKAQAVAQRHPGALVVGADQVLVLGGRALGKPADEAEARAQLRSMGGATHALVTGVAVVGPGGTFQGHEETRLTVRALAAAEIDAYLATGEWRGCAGGYRVEGRGLALFERIDGDWTNVLGLPMPLLLGELRRRGVPLFPPSAAC